MALTRTRENPRPRAIVAAATRVRLDSADEIRKALAAREDWQEIAWGYYDLVGEIKHGANLMGDALSNLRLYVGERPEDPNAVPEPTEEELPTEVLGRLDQGPGLAEIMRSSGIQYSIPGECYLVGLAARDRKGQPLGDEAFDATEGHVPERWFVLSTEAVKQRNQLVTIRDPETGRNVELREPDDYFARMWRRHEREPWRADSPIRGVLSACEELVIIEKAVRSIARSRIGNNGVFFLPDELSFGNQDPTTDEANDESEGDPFIEELQEAMLEPIQDEGHASAVVPIVIKGPGDRGEQMRHIEFTRTIDPLLAERTETALKRIAQGMNWPVELMFGLGEANHWGAGQIEESNFRQYIEPLAILAVNNLTEAFLRPSLRIEGVEDPDRFVVWFDPSQLLTDRRKRENATGAHDRLAISDAAFRRALGYRDEDAPEPEERERRIRETIVLRGRVAAIDDLLESGEADEIAEEAREGGEEGGDGQAAVAPPPSSRPLYVTNVYTEPSVTAANGGRRTDLGRRLLEIDRATRTRLEGATDAAMRRALERAGNRLRSRARKDTELAESLRGVAPRDVAATLGRTAVAGLANAEELLEGAWADLGDRFERWTSGAQRQALDLVPDLDPDLREELEAEQARHRAGAWDWLRTALDELAAERLFDPAPEPDPRGEVPADSDVPADLLREALARAGGNAEGTVASLRERVGSAVRALGVATGRLIQRAFSSSGVATEGYRWDYGAFRRATNFEPHVALDGLEFENFDDELLLNTEGFPREAYYSPGDHRGCMCDATPIMIDRR